MNLSSELQNPTFQVPFQAVLPVFYEIITFSIAVSQKATLHFLHHPVDVYIHTLSRGIC